MMYPNPAAGRLNLQVQGKNHLQRITLKATNAAGTLVYNQVFPMESNEFQTSLDVSNFSPGLYLFTLLPENGKPITRKIVIR
jgi:hypothetical protein